MKKDLRYLFNKFSSRKAQLAIETLLVYGIVLIIVLVAIAALASQGFLDPARFLPTSCNVGSEIRCTDIAMTSSGTIGPGLTFAGTGEACGAGTFPPKYDGAIFLETTDASVSANNLFDGELDIDSAERQGACLTFTLSNSYGKNIRDIRVALRDNGGSNEAINCRTALNNTVLNGGQNRAYQMACIVDPGLKGRRITGDMKVKFKVVGSAITRTLTGTYNVQLDG